MPKLTDEPLAIGGLVFFAFWLFVYLPVLHPILTEKYQHRQSYTPLQNGPAGQRRPPSDGALLQALPEHDGSAGQHNDSKEKESEFWAAKLTDWLLAAFTLALVIFTRRLYQATAGLFTETAGLREAAAEQSRDMKASIAAANEANLISRDSLHAAQRPWISEESAPASDLAWGDDGCSVTIATTIKNVGLTPAQNVDISVRIYPLTEGRRPWDELSKVITDTAIAGFGMMLFPNTDFRQNTTVTLTRADIEAYLSPPAPKTEFIIVHIMVCVRYRSTLDKQPGRTIRIYDLKRSISEGERPRLVVHRLVG
jgi:hypothetical protein